MFWANDGFLSGGATEKCQEIMRFKSRTGVWNAGSNPNDTTTIQRAKSAMISRSNGICSFSPLSITATLTNHGYLWAHELSSKWLTLPCDAAFTVLEKKWTFPDHHWRFFTHMIPELRSNIRLSHWICLFISTILWILCNGNWT